MIPATLTAMGCRDIVFGLLLGVALSAFVSLTVLWMVGEREGGGMERVRRGDHNLIGNSPGPIPVHLVITMEILSLPLRNGFIQQNSNMHFVFLK